MSCCFDSAEFGLRLGCGRSRQETAYHLPPVAVARPVLSRSVNDFGNEEFDIILQQRHGEEARQ